MADRDAEDPWTLYQRAADAVAAGGLDAALSLAARALGASGRDVALKVRVGSLLEDGGALGPAAEAYEAALAVAPSAADALEGRGRVALSQGAIERAVEVFSRAKAVRVEAPSARIGLALAYERGGRLEASIRELREAERLWPGDRHVLRALGRALGVAGQLAACREVWRRVAAIDPQDGWAASALGVVASRTQDHEGALAALARLAEGPEATAGEFGNLGAALLAAGRPAEALEVLSRGVVRWPDSLHLRLNVGCAYLELDRLPEAAEAFRAVLSRAPTWGLALLDLGVALRRAGQLDEAREALERALQFAPSDGEVMRQLAAVQAEIDAHAAT